MIVKSCTKGNTFVVDLITESGYSVRNALIVSRYGKEIQMSKDVGNDVFQKLRSQFIRSNNHRFFNGSYQAMSEFTGQCLNIKNPEHFYVIKVRKFCIYLYYF